MPKSIVASVRRGLFFCRKYDFNRKFFTLLLSFQLSSFCFSVCNIRRNTFQVSAFTFQLSSFCFSVRNFQRIAFQVSAFQVPIFTHQLFRSQFSAQYFSVFCFSSSNFHSSALKFYAQSNSYFLIIFNCVFSAQLTTNVPLLQEVWD